MAMIFVLLSYWCLRRQEVICKLHACTLLGNEVEGWRWLIVSLCLSWRSLAVCGGQLHLQLHFSNLLITRLGFHAEDDPRSGSGRS